MDVVALYVDQKPRGDLSQERAARHPGLTVYPTIAEALTRGTGKLAVDGVLLIGEHGNYPRNARGQTLYPRYEFFQQIVEVFRRSGRCVPVFNDKHLSWRWDWAREMVDTARQMGFPLMAGSSLPVTWRIPSIDLPWGAEVREAVCVGYGGVDSYDIHGLEALQCMIERRRGGESGRDRRACGARQRRLGRPGRASPRGAPGAARAARSLPQPQLQAGLAPDRLWSCAAGSRADAGAGS